MGELGEISQFYISDYIFMELAALRRGFTHLLAIPSFFYAAMDLALQTRAYPREEINDYLRLYPERREQIVRTLSYFEPLFFAPKVEVETLLCGDVGALAPLVQALAAEAELCPITGSGYTDGLYKEQWLSHKLGFDDVIVPAH